MHTEDEKPSANSLNTAMRHIFQASDPVVVLVRGHILVHHMLHGVVAARIPSSFAPPKKQRFSGLLRLAAETGAINAYEHALLKSFNDLRNGIAHELDLVADAAQEERVRENLRAAGFTKDVGSGVLAFRTYVVLMYVLLACRWTDIQRQRLDTIANTVDAAYWKRIEETAVGPLIMAHSMPESAFRDDFAKLLASWQRSGRSLGNAPAAESLSSAPANVGG